MQALVGEETAALAPDAPPSQRSPLAEGGEGGQPLPLVGSAPQVFTQFYQQRVQHWKSKREALDVFSQQQQQKQAQEEAAHCTFAPAINPRSSETASRVLNATKASEVRKAEAEKTRHWAQAHINDPFRNSDFQRELPLPGQRKQFTVQSHLSKFLQGSVEGQGESS